MAICNVPGSGGPQVISRWDDEFSSKTSQRLQHHQKKISCGGSNLMWTKYIEMSHQNHDLFTNFYWQWQFFIARKAVLLVHIATIWIITIWTNTTTIMQLDKSSEVKARSSPTLIIFCQKGTFCPSVDRFLGQILHSCWYVFYAKHTVLPCAFFFWIPINRKGCHRMSMSLYKQQLHEGLCRTYL